MWDPNLQEAANVDSVMRVHKHYVLKEPEERPGVILFGLQQMENTVVLKEQPSSALCRRKHNITAKNTLPLYVGRVYI